MADAAEVEANKLKFIAKMTIAIQTINMDLTSNVFHLILIIDKLTALGSQNKTFITQLDSWRVTGPDGPRAILQQGFTENNNGKFYRCLVNYTMKKKNESLLGKYENAWKGVFNTISATTKLIANAPAKLMNGMVAIKDRISKNVGEISDSIVGCIWGHANPVYEPRLAVEATLKKISGDKYTGLTKDKKLELMLDNLKIMKRNIHYGSEKNDNIKKYIKNYNSINDDENKIDIRKISNIEKLELEIKKLNDELEISEETTKINNILEDIKKNDSFLIYEKIENLKKIITKNENKTQVKNYYYHYKTII